MTLQTLKKQVPFDIILIIFLVILSVLFNQLLFAKIPLLQRWDNLFYDIESTVITKPVDKDIVIVAIDDASLIKLGRWPLVTGYSCPFNRPADRCRGESHCDGYFIYGS